MGGLGWGSDGVVPAGVPGASSASCRGVGGRGTRGGNVGFALYRLGKSLNGVNIHVFAPKMVTRGPQRYCGSQSVRPMRVGPLWAQGKPMRLFRRFLFLREGGMPFPREMGRERQLGELGLEVHVLAHSRCSGNV